MSQEAPGKCGFCEKPYHAAFLVLKSSHWICHRCQIKHEMNSDGLTPIGDAYRIALQKSMPGPDLFPDILHQVFQPQIEQALIQSQALVVRAEYKFDGTVPDHPIMRETVFWEEFCRSEYIREEERLVAISVGLNSAGSTKSWMIDFYLGRDEDTPFFCGSDLLTAMFQKKCSKADSDPMPILQHAAKRRIAVLAIRRHDRDVLSEKTDQPKSKKPRLEPMTEESSESEEENEESHSLSPSY
jgi:hypothetical protein